MTSESKKIIICYGFDLKEISEGKDNIFHWQN